MTLRMMVCENYISTYKKLNLPFKHISINELFRIFSEYDYINKKEALDIVLNIRKLNPRCIFFNNDFSNEKDLGRLVFFNDDYKFSTIHLRTYRPNLKAKNLDFEEIYPRILKTKIIFNEEKICENLVRKYGRGYVILDEEIFYSSLIMRKYLNCDDIIFEMINEIYRKFHIIVYPIIIDNDFFLFENQQYSVIVPLYDSQPCKNYQQILEISDEFILYERDENHTILENFKSVI